MQSSKKKDIRGNTTQQCRTGGQERTTKKLLAKGQIRLLRWGRNVSISRPDKKQPYLALCQKETHEESKALYVMLEKRAKGG